MRYQSDYTVEQTVALLDAVWDEGFLVMAARTEQEGSSRGDPALGNTLAAMSADIKRAWARLDWFDQELLEARHKHELGFEVIAFLAEMDGGAHEAAERTDAAMERMLQTLNRFTYERVDAG